jgi:formylglycine-generating enzyme required for sulfatase activity
MGKYEVTQGQYQQVMGNNPSKFRGNNNPVETVSWSDAKGMAEEMSYSTGTKVNLPSEAQWEYACRAGGAHETYCGGGGRPDRMAWFEGNSGKQTHPVGQLAANDWGLYDMSGNVWELVQDYSSDSYSGAPTDGSARSRPGNGENGSLRVARGGSWNNGPQFLRAANRFDNDPAFRYEHDGFRLARTLP